MGERQNARKQDPEKYCEHKSCGERLVRKQYASSGLEEYGHFLKRRFCGRACAISFRHATAVVRVERKVRLLPDEDAALRVIAGRHHGDIDAAIGALIMSAKDGQ